MTKSEEKLLELLLEKVEALESKVEELESAPSSGTVVHNHYHSHYHGRTWNNWPYYGYPYSVWNSTSGATPAAGGTTYTVQSAGASSVGGGSYSLASGSTSKVPSNTASAHIDYGSLEDAAVLSIKVR